MLKRLSMRHISRVSEAFNDPKKPKNLDDLISYICWHGNLHWLGSRSIINIRRDVAEMRHICKERLVAAYGNPLRALLIPISDPLLVPWPVHHEHFLRDGLKEDVAGLEERQLRSSSLIVGLIFAGYLKHVGRFQDAIKVYGSMLISGYRFEGFFGSADIHHLLANWLTELEPYRAGTYYRPGKPVTTSDFIAAFDVDSQGIESAICLYEKALAERPDSIIARRALARAFLDAKMINLGVEALSKIELRSLLARQLKAYTIAISPESAAQTDVDQLLDRLPCLPNPSAKMRRFKIVSTNEAAAAFGTPAIMANEAHFFSGTYIADSNEPELINMDLYFPDVWMSSFENVRSLGHGLLVAQDQFLITDGKGLSGQHRKLFSLDLYAVNDDMAVVDIWPAEVPVEGDAILLIGAVFNYYHWILETLPALMMLRRDPFAAKATIFFELPPQPFQIESLRIALPDVKLPLSLESNVRKYWFKKVHHVQNSSTYMVPRPSSVLMMRDAMSRHLSLPRNGKRIYLSRKSVATRQNKNEKSVKKLLSCYSIESVDTGNMTVDEQIEFFKDVELIVAPAGAALTNLIFCPASTRVVIMTSGPHHFETFTAIAAAIGQPCWVSMGSGPIRPAPYFVWTTFELEVNIPSLQRCLEAATSSLSLTS